MDWSGLQNLASKLYIVETRLKRTPTKSALGNV